VYHQRPSNPGQSGGGDSDLRRTVQFQDDAQTGSFGGFDGSSKLLLEGDQKVRRRLGVGRSANPEGSFSVPCGRVESALERLNGGFS
jgi:hypothetical protein